MFNEFMNYGEFEKVMDEVENVKGESGVMEDLLEACMIDRSLPYNVIMDDLSESIDFARAVREFDVEVKFMQAILNNPEGVIPLHIMKWNNAPVPSEVLKQGRLIGENLNKLWSEWQELI